MKWSDVFSVIKRVFDFLKKVVKKPKAQESPVEVSKEENKEVPVEKKPAV